MAPPRRPRSLPALMDDLIGEILLRVPPDEPSHLIRAALVCKPWRRIISDPAFLRRYREFHRTPPLLGFLRLDYEAPKFVSTTTSSPLSSLQLPRGNWCTLDCRHGRALFFSIGYKGVRLLLWDPITGDQQRFRLPDSLSPEIFSAAVLCVAESCNHLDCNGGPFRVVFMGTNDDDVSWVSEYSSETGAWSASTTVDFCTATKAGPDVSYVGMWPSLFTGDAIYFILEPGNPILKYDLGGKGLSVIDAPDVYNKSSILMTAEDGSLGFAGVNDYNLCLWSWKANAKGIAGWVQLRVIELKTLLSLPDSVRFSPDVIGFVEGTDTIFISTSVSIFTLKLKSGQIRKVGPRSGYGPVVPYMSFYTPDFVGARLLSP